MTTPTGRVDIHLFGPFRIEQDHTYIKLGVSGPTRQLFLYLLMNPHNAIRRQVLAHLFWKDAPIEKARAALSTALWRLNKACERLTSLTICSADDLIWVDLDKSALIDMTQLQYWYEEARKLNRSNTDLTDQIRAKLTQSIESCDGNYLEDCEADWAHSERAVAANLRLDAIMQLVADAETRNRPETAIRWVQKVLTYDPYQENLHHKLMELFVLTGQRSKAILQYESLKSLLKNELDVTPLAETLALRNQIISTSSLARSPTSSSPTTPHQQAPRTGLRI